LFSGDLSTNVDFSDFIFVKIYSKFDEKSKVRNTYVHDLYDLIFGFWCFNATFNNVSAISWRPVLVVEGHTSHGAWVTE
jgi:hypothetical protein